MTAQCGNDGKDTYFFVNQEKKPLKTERIELWLITAV
jgi:hypothetical protein